MCQKLIPIFLNVYASVTIYHIHLIFSMIILDSIRERMVSRMLFNYSLVFILCILYVCRDSRDHDIKKSTN